MSRVFSFCASLALVLVMSGGASAQLVQSAGYQSDQETNDVSWAQALEQLDGQGNDIELASCSTCSDMDGVGFTAPSGSSLKLLPMGRGSRFFVGGEYLYLRANPSEAVAYLERDLVNLTDTFHQFDFDYSSSFRFYGGCRNCCGEEVRFTFSRFDTGSDFISPTETSTIQIISPLEQTPIIDGSRVTGSADIKLDSFDLGWSKTIPIGSPLCCEDSCCDPCGDCCDPCGGWCPAWDFTFTGAVRAVDLSTNRTFNTIDASDDLLEQGTAISDFQGVGGRVGLMGRRYFGRRGICSVYMKGDLSLLIGEYDSVLNSVDYSGTVPVDAGTQSISCRHLIPVTEIEAGGTVFVTCNTSVSGGYFFSAWHDLGFRDEYNFLLQSSYDDANIMGFDGFFLRMETSF
ncbi:hypothetical protein [Aeoliella sp.]|uniref:hypothetical protein n=1 Tax=Aeoliella sp. TaxID=2795800 RepID=UPI003CCB761F